MHILRSQRTALLVLLTAALLAVLAVLQYQWVGELSAFEYEQAERNLNLATRGFTRDLGGEFRRIRNAFRYRRGRNLEGEIEEQYEEWIEAARFPGLIVDAYWVDPMPGSSREDDSGSGGVRIRRAGLRQAGLDPVEWPGSLASIRNELEGDDLRGRTRPSREWTLPFDPGRLAYVVPQDERGPSGLSVVILDRDVLMNEVIPALVDEYFGVGDEREYLVRILDSDREDSKVVYSSDTGVSGDGTADADIRRNINDEGADWVVEAMHEAGSLETFIRWHRLRNLSLGFGAVLVLGASFSLLLIATRRAHSLADRQMEFVAGVSHELRTPIAGISSLSQNLADGVVRDLGQAVRYGESINAESRRLNEMVEKVLHFSAIRSGQYRYDREPVDVRSIVEPELEAIGRCSDEKLRLKTRFADDLPPVWGDAQALRSVVHNLVSNAVKFGGKDGEVSISTERVDTQGKAEVELAVGDSGPGIARADLSHIFEPFYRGDAARAHQVGGSGLGLSLVREIVTAHRGRVEVDAREGEGSTFRVYLPAADPGGAGGSAV